MLDVKINLKRLMDLHVKLETILLKKENIELKTLQPWHMTQQVIS